MSRCDVTIIGGGPVGLYASFYAGLRGLSVRIIDSLPELGGQLTALYPEKYIYDMPGFPKVLAKDLAADLITQGTQFGPEVVLSTQATRLEADEEGYVIFDDKGHAFPTRTIIIAAGAGAFTPTKIGALNEEKFIDSGVYYGVRDKSQFEQKRVAIVGGGDSAFDWALNLHPIASQVQLIHRRDIFRAHEHSVSKVRELGIPMHLFRTVTEVHGNGTVNAITLQHVETKELEKLEVDAVVVNIGFKSTLGPIKDWGLEIEKNQIVVDPFFETSLPNVFSVGDVCTFANKIKLIATGVGEAATAVCVIKTRLDSTAKLFPGHSSDLKL